MRTLLYEVSPSRRRVISRAVHFDELHSEADTILECYISSALHLKGARF